MRETHLEADKLLKIHDTILIPVRIWQSLDKVGTFAGRYEESSDVCIGRCQDVDGDGVSSRFDNSIGTEDEWWNGSQAGSLFPQIWHG